MRVEERVLSKRASMRQATGILIHKQECWSRVTGRDGCHGTVYCVADGALRLCRREAGSRARTRARRRRGRGDTRGAWRGTGGAETAAGAWLPALSSGRASTPDLRILCLGIPRPSPPLPRPLRPASGAPPAMPHVAARPARHFRGPARRHFPADRRLRAGRASSGVSSRSSLRSSLSTVSPTRPPRSVAVAMATVPPLAARRVGPRSIQSFTSSTAEKPAAPTRPPPAKPVTLAKRILFPTLPPDADLPPLLLSHDASPELNAALYDFIALALRAYVNTWWSKITRYDKEFLPEVTRILTVVIRNLEARLTATDLSPFVFRDFPTLLTQHWTDYRNAQAKLHTSYAVGGAASIAQLFHQMQPHMAVSAEGVIDPVYVRQAVDHVLKTCLPPENYEPETERYIVREIILKVVVGSVLPRVTQPWFIHKLILDQLGPEKVSDEVLEVRAFYPSALGIFGQCQPQGTRSSNINTRFMYILGFRLQYMRALSSPSDSIESESPPDYC